MFVVWGRKSCNNYVKKARVALREIHTPTKNAKQLFCLNIPKKRQLNVEIPTLPMIDSLF